MVVRDAVISTRNAMRAFQPSFSAQSLKYLVYTLNTLISSPFFSPASSSINMASAAERRKSAHIPSSPPGPSKHAHTRSIGSALDFLAPSNTGTGSPQSIGPYNRGAPSSPLGMHASMVGGSGSQPMSPASSRGARYAGGSVPMSPAGTGGWGNEVQWSDIQAR